LSDTSTSFDGEPCDRTKEGSCLCGREWSLTMWTRDVTDAKKTLNQPRLDQVSPIGMSWKHSWRKIEATTRRGEKI
jgi:hypothetical protein